jgi:hypothetical protein
VSADLHRQLIAPITTCGDAGSPHLLLAFDQSDKEEHPMSGPSTGERFEAGHYEIRLQGHLGPRWTEWFDGLSLAREGAGVTVLAGPVVDQAALHGLLQKVRDLGLPLLSVRQVDAVHTERPTRAPHEAHIQPQGDTT